MLYQERFNYVTTRRLTRFGTACRLPDYHKAKQLESYLTLEQYADEVSRGIRVDRTMTPLLRYGLIFKGVIHNHMDDIESGNAAAILEWKP